MISVVSYTIPIDAAELILIWPHEFAENMQTNEVVLFIAYFMSWVWFCFVSFNVITENEADHSFQTFHL